MWSSTRSGTALSVERELELPRETHGISGTAHVVADLEGRDLGEIEDVVDEDPVAGRLDARVPVDGEVPERVRLRPRRGEEERGDGDKRGEKDLHGP